MNNKRRILNLVILFSLSVILLAGFGCKKQPKCGCDGDRLDSLNKAHVYIQYNAENKTAQFTPLADSYSIFYFCNPSDFMGELTKYAQGEEILISGDYFYECNYVLNSGNSSYYSPWRIYQIEVTAVEPDIYGK